MSDFRTDELNSALALASQAELDAIAHLLFQPKFNPIDYLYTQQPAAIRQYPHRQQIQQISARFRFLAADGVTVLRNQSHQLSYRRVLQQAAKFLRLKDYQTLSALALEAEIFLALLDKTWRQLDPSARKQITIELRQQVAGCDAFAQLPVVLQKNPMALLAKGSSAVTVSAILKPWLLSHIARQFALHLARYQVAKQALVKGGLTVAAQVQTRATAHLASRSMVMTTARYGATRGLFALLGPALWTWFVADLGWRAIATNHSRIIPVVFALAQIRLTRSIEAASEAIAPSHIHPQLA